MTRRTLFLAVACLSAAPLRAAEPPSVKALEEQMQKLIDDVTPSVVAVVASHAKYPDDAAKKKPGQLGGYDPPARMDDGRGRWFARRQELNRLDLSLSENVADNLFGSGAVLDDRKGLVLVPYHLVEGGSKVFVRAASGKGCYADIFAADTKSDLAVLKLLAPLDGLKAVTPAEVRLAESPTGQKPTLKRGSFVVAVGHPLASGAGDGQPAASWGVVSNVRRSSAPPPESPDPLVPRPLHAYGGLIQLDARVTLGSSGAAVFDLDGRLVGLGSTVAAVYGSEANGGYAVPLDAGYRRIIDTLKKGLEVEYGFLGVAPKATEGGGVLVDAVTTGCPAALADLKPGDLLTAIDGNLLKNTDDVHLYVGGALADTQVVVEYRRGGRAMRVPVTLAKNTNPFPSIASVAPPAPFGLAVDYQSVRLLAQQQRGRFGPPRPEINPPPGVVLRDDKAVAGSPAERRFKDLGDVKAYWVITHVDGKPVKTPREFRDATAGRTRVELFVCDAEDTTDRRTIVLP